MEGRQASVSMPVLAPLWCLEEWLGLLGKRKTPRNAAVLEDWYVQDLYSARDLRMLADGLLWTLPPLEKKIFIRRYGYLDTSEEIAQRFGLSRRKTTAILKRLGDKLHDAPLPTT